MQMQIKTRFQLRCDSYDKWVELNPLLKMGEIAIAYLSNDGNASESTVLIKTGPGYFNDLPFTSALAADVFSWAKKTEIEFIEWLDALFAGSTLNSINEIRNVKADKAELDNYLKIEDYIKGETGGSIDISNFLTKSSADNYYAPKNILEQAYPIGAIYLSMVDTNPNLLFGFGTWQKIENRFLLAESSTYPAGSEGGEAEHTLTELEMPAHDHEFDRHQLWRNEIIPPSTTSESEGYGVSNKTLPIYTDTTIATGAGEAHNNMPPYLAVFMWQRIN